MKKLLIFGLASFTLIAANGVSPTLAQDNSQVQNPPRFRPLAAGCIRGDVTTGLCLEAAPGYVLEGGSVRREELFPPGCVWGDRATGRCTKAAEGYVLDSNSTPRPIEAPSIPDNREF